MTEDSGPPTFAKLINERTAIDKEALATYRQEIEAESKRQLRVHSEHLTQCAVDERQRTESAMRIEIRKSAKLWVRTLLIGTALFGSIWIVNLGMWRWHQRDLIDRLEALELRISLKAAHLRVLENQAWGVSLYEGEGGRHAMLPPGSEVRPTTASGHIPVWLPEE